MQFQKYKNTFFCYFKNDKKSIFAQEKSLKLPKMQFSDFFQVQKLIFFPIFENANIMWFPILEHYERSQNGGKLFETFYLAKKVVNCGGNYSDELDRLVPRNGQMMPPPFVIQPGCGCLFTFDIIIIQLFVYNSIYRQGRICCI